MNDIEKFLCLMKFPEEWLQWKMIPEELKEFQLKNYRPGDERGAEHDRNGAFHWWLKRTPTKEQLIALVKLSFLDSDQIMASDVRGYILQSKFCDDEIIRLIEEIKKNKGKIKFA